jgi:hypothetical protein
MHQQEEEWGFLLIDASNAFDEQNRTGMLWTVWHEWPTGARFVFNYCKHLGTFMIRGKDGSGAFIYSKEGITQGDPLYMFAYGVGILPLIGQLKAEFLEVEQPWYADDKKNSEICLYFSRLLEIGLNFGYYPEPSKSILVVPQHSLEAAQALFANMNFKITTGSRYLGSFIGEDSALWDWIRGGKTEEWAEAVTELAPVAPKYPQTAHTGLQKSLQQDRQFVQKVTTGIGPEFKEVEQTLAKTFLPALFGDSYRVRNPYSISSFWEDHLV